MPKLKCAPKIWKKFNATEKELWNEFYNICRVEMNFPDEFQGKKFAKQREVLAHNLACQLVWAVENLPEK